MIKCRYIIIGKYAEYDPAGLLNVIGGDSTTIRAETVPHVEPKVSFAARLVVDPEDVGSKLSLEVEIVKSETSERVAEAAQMEVPGLDGEFSEGIGLGLALSFGFVIFPKHGKYTLNIRCNGEIIGSTDIRVNTSEYFAKYQSLIEGARKKQIAQELAEGKQE